MKDTLNEKHLFTKHQAWISGIANRRYRAVSLEGKGTGVASMGAGLYLTSEEQAKSFALSFYGNNALIEEYAVTHPLKLIDYYSKLFQAWRKEWYMKYAISHMTEIDGEYYLEIDEYPAKNAPHYIRDGYGKFLTNKMEATIYLDGVANRNPLFGICLINPQNYELINTVEVDAPKTKVLSLKELI